MVRTVEGKSTKVQYKADPVTDQLAHTYAGGWRKTVHSTVLALINTVLHWLALIDTG